MRRLACLLLAGALPAAAAQPELGTDAQRASGAALYGKFCSQCHGDNGQTRGATFPNLTRTPLLPTQEGFDNVVLKGVLAEKGMASFADSLKTEDTQALRAYLVARANELKKMPPMPGFGPAPPTRNQHDPSR